MRLHDVLAEAKAIPRDVKKAYLEIQQRMAERGYHVNDKLEDEEGLCYEATFEKVAFDIVLFHIFPHGEMHIWIGDEDVGEVDDFNVDGLMSIWGDYEAS